MRQLTCYGRMRIMILAIMLCAVPVRAQELRFSTQREVAIPDYAVVRIGPFYSTVLYSQSVAYRWTRSEGTGTDFLRQNRRGVIRKEGNDLPIISRLRLRNYLLISRHADLDLSVDMRYEYYPLDTQKNEFIFDLVDEGIFGNISLGLMLTPYVRGNIYNNLTIRTDYIDTRGLEDRYGGTRYEHLNNRLGLELDWLLAKDKSLGLSLSRTDIRPFDDEFDYRESVSYYESLIYEQAVFRGVVLGARAGFRQTDYKVSDRADTRQQDYSAFARTSFGRSVEPGQGVGVRLSDASELTLHVGSSIGYSGSARAVVRDERGETSDVEASGDNVTFNAGASLRTNLRRDLWHQFKYEQGLRGGFDSAFNEYEDYGYELHWRGIVSTLDIDSTYSMVTPSRSDRSEYTDWRSRLVFTYPLLRDVEVVDAVFDTRYNIRENSITRIDPDTALETEQTSDYTTWVTRLGTRFHITRNIDFSTYFQHTERESESRDLEYTRDTFEARATYSHQF